MYHSLSNFKFCLSIQIVLWPSSVDPIALSILLEFWTFPIIKYISNPDTMGHKPCTFCAGPKPG